MQTVPGRLHAGQHRAPRRRRVARLAPRRDPALDDLPPRNATPPAGERQSMTRTFLPAGDRRPGRGCSSSIASTGLIRDRGRAFRAELTGADGAPVHDRLRARRGLRRRDPDAGSAATIRIPGAGRKGPGRAPDRQAGRPVRRAGQRRRRRARSIRSRSSHPISRSVVRPANPASWRSPSPITGR